MPGRQLYFKDMREDSCKISMLTVTCPSDAEPFYEDKNGENRVVVEQIYEFPSKNFN